MTHDRAVIKLETLEIFQETSDKQWDARVAAWLADHSNPSPMPRGHRMFAHPEEYGCKPVMLMPKFLLLFEESKSDGRTEVTHA